MAFTSSSLSNCHCFPSSVFSLPLCLVIAQDGAQRYQPRRGLIVGEIVSAPRPFKPS